MNAQDEEDFVFACLLGVIIQSLRQQEEGQSVAGSKKADKKSKIHMGARMVIGRHRR